MTETPPRPVFSIITVSFGNKEKRERTRASLDAQTVRTFEWIVTDGKNEERSEALNNAIDKAQGDYLLFLDEGDALADTDILETLCKYLEKSPDLLYGDALETVKGKPDAKPRYIRARSSKELPRGMFTRCAAILYRRAVVKKLNLYHSLIYPFAADYDFTVRFLQGSKKIIYLPRPVCLCRDDRLSWKKAFQRYREQYLIREKLELCSQPLNVWYFTIKIFTRPMRALFPWEFTIGKRRKAK